MMENNKRFQRFESVVEDTMGVIPITLWQDKKQQKKYCDELNKLHEENITIKKDEKQLSIDFMGFKMKLIEVLQKNYDYAYNQRQKNLDDVKIAHAYAMLMGTVKGIAEDMEVDLDV